MKGTIRTVVGLMIVFGSVGAFDADPHGSLFLQVCIAIVGIAILSSGVRAMEKQ